MTARVGKEYYEINGESEYLLEYWSLTVPIVLLVSGGLGWLLFTGRSSAIRTRALIVMLAATCFETLLNIEQWIPYSTERTCILSTETTSFLRARVGSGRVQPVDRVAVPGTLNLQSVGLETAAGRGSVGAPYRSMLLAVNSNAYTGHPTQHLFFMQDTTLVHPVWDLLDVRFFVASKDLDEDLLLEQYPEGLRVHRLSDGSVLERVPAPNHVNLFETAVHIPLGTDLTELYREGWDFARVALVEDPALARSVTARVNPGVGLGEATRLERSTNRIGFRVSLTKAAHVVVSEQFSRNWSIRANGRRIQPHRYFHLFVGFPLEPGDWDVAMDYRLRGQTLANVLSIAGVLTFLLSLAIWHRRTALTTTSR